MANRLAQYGSIAHAFGLSMSYNSSSASLDVVDIPKGHTKVIEAMLDEISHFDDTTTYVDGVASFCVVDYIDGQPTPIPEQARLNILHALGLMKGDKYIHQILMLHKNNRSWHQSGVENECEFFGEVCTHRGINPDPDRKGRTSTRKPDEYHVRNGKGVIVREQLVTPNLEKVFRMIPEENLTTGRIGSSISTFQLKRFKSLDVEDKLRVISELQELVDA